MCPLAAPCAAYGDGFDVLAAQHRAAAAATGVTAVVRDGGVANAMLAGGADGSELKISAETRLQCRFGLRAAGAAYILDCFQAGASIIDDEDRKLGGAADDRNPVATAALAGDGEAAADQRIVDPIGERALADHRKLRGGGERAADQWTEREDERRLGRERIARGAPFVQEQSHAQSASADEVAHRFFRQRYAVSAAVRRVDSEIMAVVSERHERSAIRRRQQKG